MAIQTPFDVDCMGKIIIKNMRMRYVTDSSLRNWLGRYGTIQETSIFKHCAVVKFNSDLEAAGVVQCEDGIRRYGSVVKIKHAEPHVLWELLNTESRSSDRQNTPPYTYANFASRSRHKFTPSTEGNDSSRTRKKSSSSKSPPSSRHVRTALGNRDNHPLTWLSEAADQSSASSVKQSTNSINRTNTADDAINKTIAKTRPYEVAILAISHDLVPYAEAVQERIAAIRDPTINNFKPITSHIMVLVNIDHLAPCMQDLTNDGVLFAVIINASNWTHSSCTLRILHSPTQQEHRNMPLNDAINLLMKDYSTLLMTPISNNPTSNVPTQNLTSNQSNGLKETPKEIEPEIDDPTFLKPNRHVSSLLRMLADSRVLSVGELDELSAFISKRRARLTSQLTSTNQSDGTASNAALKSRILGMLYPNLKPQSIAATPAINSGDINTASGNSQNESSSLELATKLKSPFVQQALNNLLKTSMNSSNSPANAPFGEGYNSNPNTDEQTKLTSSQDSNAWQSWNYSGSSANANTWTKNYTFSKETGWKSDNSHLPSQSNNHQIYNDNYSPSRGEGNQMFTKRDSWQSRGSAKRYRGNYQTRTPPKLSKISKPYRRGDDQRRFTPYMAMPSRSTLSNQKVFDQPQSGSEFNRPRIPEVQPSIGSKDARAFHSMPSNEPQPCGTSSVVHQQLSEKTPRNPDDWSFYGGNYENY